MSGTEYTQGVCDDGAAILRDGAQIAIEEILADLRRFEICRQALIDICKTLDGVEKHHADDPEALRAIAWVALEKAGL